jgi:hypothetical protein
MLVPGLMAEGVRKDQIKRLGRETPDQLLMGHGASQGEYS